MNPAILTMLYRLGGLGGMILISWQLIQHVPILERDIATVKATQETIVQQHETIGTNLQKYMDLSVKLQRANCLNTAETKEERLNCNQ